MHLELQALWLALTSVHFLYAHGKIVKKNFGQSEVEEVEVQLERKSSGVVVQMEPVTVQMEPGYLEVEVQTVPRIWTGLYDSSLIVDGESGFVTQLEVSNDQPRRPTTIQEEEVRFLATVGHLLWELF